MAHSKMAPKRKVNVQGQPHSLAYINKDEARMLRRMGGSGKPGPSGVPTYIPDDGNRGGGDFGRADSGPSRGEYGGGDSRDPGNFGGKDGNENNNTFSPPSTSIPTPTPRPKKPADQIAREKARAEIMGYGDNFTGLAGKMPIGAVLNAIGGASRDRIASRLDEKGSVAIRDKNNRVVGVMHDGPFGLGKVYSGRMLDKADYTGPAEFANNVTMDGGNDSDGPNIRGGAKPKQEVVESIDGEVNMPDAPTGGEGGDATEDAKRRSKMGKESTISTTSQGLLGSAKTRNRSLMSGLIS